MLNTIKNQLGNMIPGKLRRGPADQGVVPCYFVRFGALALAVQFENAMFNAFGFIVRNTDKIDDGARPASHQQLKRSNSDLVSLFRQTNDMLIFFRQGLEVGG